MIVPIVAMLAAFTILCLFAALTTPKQHRYTRHTIHHYKTKQAPRCPPQ